MLGGALENQSKSGSPRGAISWPTSGPSAVSSLPTPAALITSTRPLPCLALPCRESRAESRGPSVLASPVSALSDCARSRDPALSPRSRINGAATRRRIAPETRRRSVPNWIVPPTLRSQLLRLREISDSARDRLFGLLPFFSPSSVFCAMVVERSTSGDGSRYLRICMKERFIKAMIALCDVEH